MKFFQFIKETVEVSQMEYAQMEWEISKLSSTVLSLPTEENNGKKLNIEVRHKLFCTMVDGKVLNAIFSQNSQASCYICLAKPSDMNDNSKRSINIHALKFGISSLHAWLRCFECVLHISYRLDIKRWRISQKEDKEIVLRKKKEVQSLFRSKMGLLVDHPRQGGSGNSNDGNTARRAFQNPKVFAEITKVDIVLISHLGTILGALNSPYNINIENFTSLCQKAFNLYVKRYHWFYMPVTMHKILVHGPDIISSLPLPIGVFSEEAQETRLKDAKYFRLYHTRKMSRVSTMRDQFERLMATSDPLISSINVKKRKSYRIPL